MAFIPICLLSFALSKLISTSSMSIRPTTSILLALELTLKPPRLYDFIISHSSELVCETPDFLFL